MSGNDIDGIPKGLRYQIGTGNPIIYYDRSTLVNRESVRATRPKPGEPGRMQFKIWNEGGSYVLHDFDRIRVDDPWYNPAGLYPRHFAGVVVTHRDTVTNNINLEQDIDAADYNWYWQNPPAMPTAPFRIGAAPVWLPNHRYFVNDEVQPSPFNRHKYKVQSVGASGIGMSGDTQPAFPTGAGGTVTEGNAGPPDTRITWVETGSSLVTDVTAINQMLDVYYPSTLFPHTRTGIQNLIASIPSIEVGVDWTPHRVMQEIAKYAGSTHYYELWPAWQATHAYSVGDTIEVPGSNTIVWIVDHIEGTGTSGGSIPAFTTIPDLGVIMPDGTAPNRVFWRSDHRLGRWRASSIYVAGNFMEPQTGGTNGLYYKALNTGTTAASPPTWPTTIGNTVTSGTLTLMCMGSTSVDPAWSWDIPSDNSSHTASWNPIASWYDTSSTGSTGILVAATEYTDITDPPVGKIHYKDITVNREGTEYANRWYVFGKNNSFAMVSSDAEIQNKAGLVVARTWVDTSESGPATYEDCVARGNDLLATSIVSETIQVDAADPVDVGMLGRISMLKIKNDLLGLDPTNPNQAPYPVSDAQVDFSGQAPIWHFTLGQPFLTDRESVYSRRRGGREFVGLGAPPVPATWDTDWVLSNVGNPSTGRGLVQVHWRTGGEANLQSSHVLYQLSSENFRREGGMIPYPRQDIAIDNLQPGETITFYVCTINNHGQYRKDANGNPVYSASPPLVIAAPLYWDHVPNHGAEEAASQTPSDPLYWNRIVSFGGGAVRDTADFTEGNHCFRLKTNGGASDLGSFRSQQFLCSGVPGDDWTLRLHARTPDGVNRTLLVTVAYWTFDPATQTFTGVDAQSTTFTTTGSWQEFRFATNPATFGAYTTIQIINQTSSANSNIYVDDIVFEQQRRTEHYGDASVTSAKIAATGVTAATYKLVGAAFNAQGQSTSAKELAGTSFPGSPSTDDFFYRTDLGVMCRYNGSRWVGPPETWRLYDNGPVLTPIGFTTNQAPWMRQMPNSKHVYQAERITWHGRVDTTNGLSDYWTLRFGHESNSLGGVIDCDVTTQIWSAGVNDIKEGTSFTTVPLDFTSSGVYTMFLELVKTGSPGKLNLWGVELMVHRVYT